MLVFREEHRNDFFKKHGGKSVFYCDKRSTWASAETTLKHFETSLAVLFAAFLLQRLTASPDDKVETRRYLDYYQTGKEAKRYP